MNTRQDSTGSVEEPAYREEADRLSRTALFPPPGPTAGARPDRSGGFPCNTRELGFLRLFHRENFGLGLAIAGIPCYPGWMPRTASPRDLAHFAAIAAAEADNEERRCADAARTPPGQLMLAGFALAADLPITPALLAEIDARTDGQMELARRRIALGLASRRQP